MKIVDIYRPGCIQTQCMVIVESSIHGQFLAIRKEYYFRSEVVYSFPLDLSDEERRQLEISLEALYQEFINPKKERSVYEIR